MKLQIQVGDLNLAGESVADILVKVRALLTQKQKQLVEAEKKYKAVKKEAAQLEKAVKELEAANQIQPTQAPSAPAVATDSPKESS